MILVCSKIVSVFASTEKKMSCIYQNNANMCFPDPNNPGAHLVNKSLAHNVQLYLMLSTISFSIEDSLMNLVSLTVFKY